MRKKETDDWPRLVAVVVAVAVVATWTGRGGERWQRQGVSGRSLSFCLEFLE